MSQDESFRAAEILPADDVSPGTRDTENRFSTWIVRGAIALGLWYLPLLNDAASAQQRGSALNEDAIEIIRDSWGIPHIYAQREEALFYGLGYAMAEDRLFQMTLKRREAQGRLAEVFGAGHEDRLVQSDRLARLFNIVGAAENELQTMNAVDRACLQAFAKGVNAYLNVHWYSHSPLFVKYGGKPDAWEAADCLAIWIQLAAAFSPAWMSEVQARREFEKDRKPYRAADIAKSEAAYIDDAAAIVTEKEFERSNPKAYRELMKVGKNARDCVDPFPPEAPKASHNWVVSGARSITGKPLLEGKTQASVMNPGMKYEFHISGGRYNVRGMTWPGVPACLCGFNEHCAWMATALNSDCGDLFEEKVHLDNPRQYLFRGEWKRFFYRNEMIRVQNAEAISFHVLETVHGPIVNDFVQGIQPGETYTLQMTVLKPESSSVGAVLGMMRARDWSSFRRAMSGYYGPGAHIVYADVHGDIGYQALAKIPSRSYRRTLPRQGWTGEDEWEMLPFRFMPSMKNPRQNFVSTANGLPTGAWHPYVTCNGFGGGPRSWRLRELFAGDRVFSVSDFEREIGQDAVNVAIRDFRTLVLAIANEDGDTTEELARAIEILRQWDGQLLTDSPGYPVGAALSSVIERFVKKPNWQIGKARGHSAGWSGFVKWMRVLRRRYEEAGETPQGASIRQWFEKALVQAYAQPETKNPPWTAQGVIHQMPYQENRLGIDSLDPAADLQSPPLKAPMFQTLWSQRGENYVQLNDFSNLDRSMALLPPGVSERPDSPHFRDQMKPWANGTLRPAPISRSAVEAIMESRTELAYPGI